MHQCPPFHIRDSHHTSKDRMTDKPIVLEAGCKYVLTVETTKECIVAMANLTVCEVKCVQRKWKKGDIVKIVGTHLLGNIGQVDQDERPDGDVGVAIEGIVSYTWVKPSEIVPATEVEAACYRQRVASMYKMALDTCTMDQLLDAMKRRVTEK